MNSQGNTVEEMDPGTGAVVRHLRVGRHPSHIVASYDLTTLWVLNELSNTVTALDPRDGSPGLTLPVTDPHNMYFTPDGRYAVIVEQARQILAFRDPHTMALLHQLPVACRRVDQLDFTADGRYAIASCASSSLLVKVDLTRQRVLGYLQLGPHSAPGDLRTTPDGAAMYIADEFRSGIWKINPTTFTITTFLPTGRDPRGLYISRDSQQLFITARSGSVSVLSFAASVITHRWRLTGETPDAGGLSTDGTILWLTNRRHHEIYAINTRTGQLLTQFTLRTPADDLTVYPQPGRTSLSHTGVFR